MHDRLRRPRAPAHASPSQTSVRPGLISTAFATTFSTSALAFASESHPKVCDRVSRPFDLAPQRGVSMPPIEALSVAEAGALARRTPAMPSCEMFWPFPPARRPRWPSAAPLRPQRHNFTDVLAISGPPTARGYHGTSNCYHDYLELLAKQFKIELSVAIMFV